MPIVSAQIGEDLYVLMNKKCEESGRNKSQYLTRLIQQDLGIESSILNNGKVEHGMLSSLKRAFGVEEKMVPTENIIVPKAETPKPQPKRIKNSQKPDAVWIPPMSARKEYRGKLHYVGEKISAKHVNSVKKSHTDLKATMSIVLFIDEVYSRNKEFRIKDIKEFQRLFHLKKHTVEQLLWNLMESNFKNLISTFKKEIADVKFDIANVGNFIMMNGRMSDITIPVAKEIVSIMQNSNTHDIKIWELQQSYGYNDPLHIRIIADNYDNSCLLNLLKETPTIEVMNNPSKRRNAIRNGLL